MHDIVFFIKMDASVICDFMKLTLEHTILFSFQIFYFKIDKKTESKSPLTQNQIVKVDSCLLTMEYDY